MKWLSSLLNRRRPAPAPSVNAHIILLRSGQLTSRPQVHISVGSRRGCATIMTRPDDVQGNAMVEVYGDSYASILGIPLTDERK